MVLSLYNWYCITKVNNDERRRDDTVEKNSHSQDNTVSVRNESDDQIK